MKSNTFNLARIFSRFCAIFFVIGGMSSYEFLLTWAQGGRPFFPKIFFESKNIQFRGTFKLNILFLTCVQFECIEIECF
jgi:hypothetical protein